MPQSTPFFTRSRILMAALGLFLMVGGFLRFYHISKQPYWMDEGYTINAVLSIQEKGASILDSGVHYSCPLYCYPTSWIATAFGSNAASYRFLAALAGIVLIGIIFIVARKLFNKRIALLSSFFITFSYLQIAWSRQVRWYTLFSVFFWLAILFFHQFLYKEKNKWLSLIFTIIFTVLSCITHGVGYLMPFLFVGWYLIDAIFLQKKFSIKKLLIITGGSILSILVLIFIFKSGMFTSLRHALSFHYELPYYLSFFLRTYWLFILFSIIGLYSATGQEASNRYFLAFIFIGYLLPLSFLTNVVQYRYLFYATPVLFILGSIGMYEIYKIFTHTWQRILYIVLIAGLFFTVAGGVIIPRTNYYLESDNPETLGSRPSYAYTPQPDWNDAYNFVKSAANESDIIISTMPQFNKIFLGKPGYWLQYNYLGIGFNSGITKDKKEFYVNAQVLYSVHELKTLTSNTHGYLIIDYMALDGKLNANTIQYIKDTLTQVFYKKTNSYSQVWVYKF